MKNITFTFTRYIKDRLRFIMAYLVIISTYLIVFSLYSLSLDIVLYGTLLASSFLILYGIYDFYKYFNRHKLLLDVNHNIAASLSNLPSPETLLEEDYQELVKTLYEDKTDLSSRLDARHTDLVEYFTMWTHQIKTPLSAADLLIQASDNEIKEDLSNIIFEIGQYVDMALQYLRIESITSDLRLEKYDLMDIVKEAIKSYSKTFIYKNIRLNLKDMDKEVITDRKWLLFVIKQILSNALKYTYQGEISIYLDHNTLIIQDSGIGIRDEDIPRIFERGFTGYNGRMNKKSTGLGLYLSKTILDKLSHGISISSQVGLGTMVKIDFSTVDIIND